MAKDPAFLFYTGDFSTGTQFLSDEQLGKYLRLLMAQHQHGHLPEKHMIMICKSYDQDIFSKFKQDDKGLWYNERLEIEIDKRKNFISSRSKNKEGKTKPKNTSKSYDFHMENKNKDINEDVILTEYENWTKQIVEGNDQFFEQMFVKESIPQSPNIQFWIYDHRDLLNRYPKMRPPNQQAFRQSCIKHIRENYKKPTNGKSNGTKQDQVRSAAEYVANHYGNKPK